MLIGLLVVIGIVTQGFVDLIALGSFVFASQLLGVALLGAVTVLLLVLVVMPRERATSGARLWGRWLFRIVTVAGLLLLWPLPLLLLVTMTTPNGAEVLAPSSPAGCRVAVRESSFLFSGGGTVHVVPEGHIVGRLVGSFSTDDGSPFESGAYRLSWDGEQADLLLIPADGAQVWPQELAFSCG